MVSVCIATHNGEKYIKEQIDSILPQLSSKDEIIISDDGSTDRTLDIIREYNEERIKIFKYSHKKRYSHAHAYVTHNFENAILHSMGDYIFLSDQDDVWLPNKIEKCMKELQNSGIVVHNMRIVDESLNDTGEIYYKNGFHRFRNYFMKSGKYYGCSIGFRRDYLKYILPYPAKLILHDYWTGIIAEFFGGVSYIDEPLILYRYRKGSVSHNTQNSLIFKIKYRLYTMLNLYCRILKFKIKSLFSES